MRVRIALETGNDVKEFVNIASLIDHPIYLTDGNLKVCAKSLLGVVYSKVEWKEIWCECEIDIYHKIEKFIIT